jgi:hypothetical protein
MVISLVTALMLLSNSSGSASEIHFSGSVWECEKQLTEFEVVVHSGQRIFIELYDHRKIEMIVPELREDQPSVKFIDSSGDTRHSWQAPYDAGKDISFRYVACKCAFTFYSPEPVSIDETLGE